MSKTPLDFTIWVFRKQELQDGNMIQKTVILRKLIYLF